jgi:hypothetical protein
MARPINNGWDFIRVGKTYHYREGRLVAEIEVTEDNSTIERYDFQIKINKSIIKDATRKTIRCDHIKDIKGIYSGMPALYEMSDNVYTDILNELG